jgi:SAM-dependent methyltransferase
MLRARKGGRNVDLVECVRARLRDARLAPERLTAEAWASLDQFHPGGLGATLALAQLAGVRSGDVVLDIGGGPGGPARILARRWGATVTVLDLNLAYCRLGHWLTAQSGDTDRVNFVAGDAVALPFRAAAFDVAWTQASGMNIAAKERLYAEIRRVLRPGGRLVFEELLTGRRVPLRFPVPWADEQDRSYLRPPEALRRLLVANGFRERSWADVSAATLVAMGTLAAGAPSALGVHLLLGPDAASKLQNLGRNLAEGRLAIVRGVFERV